MSRVYTMEQLLEMSESRVKQLRKERDYSRELVQYAQKLLEKERETTKALMTEVKGLQDRMDRIRVLTQD
jgi:hypothetical protein